MQRWLPGVLLLLSGCKGCRPDDELPELLFAVDAEATAVFVGDAEGPGPLSVPVFGVNLVGGVVPASGITVGGGGPLTATSPEADGTGWGHVTLDTTEPGAWSVTASLGATADDGQAWVVAGEPPEWGLPAVSPGVATEALVMAGKGAAWSDGGAVWWSPLSAGLPVRVLDLPAPVVGMMAAALDADGVPDLLVWSEGHVVALRGRSDGGLTWLAGWAVAQGAVVGVATSLPLGDADPDLVVAVVDAGRTSVAWLEGANTAWTYSDLLEVDYPAWGVSTEDLDADGEGEITLLTTDGLLRRYTKVDGGWVAAGAGEFELGIGEGGRLLPSEDLDGDGLEDLVVIGPEVSTGTWQAYVVSTPDRLLYRMFTATKNDSAPTALRGGVEDLDGDGLYDLVLTTDRDLRRAAWNTTIANFDLFVYANLPGGVPFAIGDGTGDDVPDVLLGGADLRLREGERDGGGWNVRPGEGERLDLNLVGDPWLGDLDGDDIVDLVSFADAGGGLLLQAYLGQPADDGAAETLVGQGGLGLTDDAAPLDLAVCGRDVYALVATGADATLWRATVDPVEGLVGAEWATGIDGETVACGHGAVAVGSTSGRLTWFDDGGVPTVDSSWSDAVTDLAVGDRGAGPEAFACGSAGCSIVAADLDGDGLDDVATADAGGVEVVTPTALHFVRGTGALSVGDADGDGVMDLIAASDGVVRVYRVVPGGVAAARIRSQASPVQGRAGVGDLDGDGRADLLLTGLEDDAGDGESWDGVLLYVRAP